MPNRKQIFIFSVLGIVAFILGYYEILTVDDDLFDVRGKTSLFDKAVFIGSCALLFVMFAIVADIIWDTISKLNKWWINRGKTDEVIKGDNDDN